VVVAWVSCAAATFLALDQISLDWRHRTLLGKFAAGSFLSLLVLVPVTIAIRLKKGKPVTAAWVSVLGYSILILALQAFGPLAHLR